jgi:protein-S-isoprenylcysteine O-methyltransferase Ste14
VSLWRHLAAILFLPVVATVVIPALIVRESGATVGPLAFVGAPLIALGLALLVSTIKLFASVGRGTLAPWDPTTRLVVRGPYRYVRNPMISGVLFVLLGEAALFGSVPLLIWFGAFLAINVVYFPLVEEPGLSRRFGPEYAEYKANVRRWVPRIRPWR